MIAPKTKKEIYDNMESITAEIDTCLLEIQKLELIAASNIEFEDEIAVEIDILLETIDELEDKWEFLNSQLEKESV